jgi:stage III sporulation protein AE
VKNAVGVYGLIAVAAIAVGPFLRIGVQYLLLKLTAAFCGVFGSKKCSDLVGDFSSAMGILLAMTGAVCLILLISLICFMKGVGA